MRGSRLEQRMKVGDARLLKSLNVYVELENVMWLQYVYNTLTVRQLYLLKSQLLEVLLFQLQIRIH